MLQTLSQFDDEHSAPVELMEEERRWRSRDVRYFAGTWHQIRGILPEFDLESFSVGTDEPSNPFFRTVVRRAQTRIERPIPVGLVSNTYRLVQHTEVGDLCVRTLAASGYSADDLKCQAGISELGEWVNLRFELPASLGYRAPDGYPLVLRLETFNSVDGSSRLTLLMSWFRQVCSNGMVIRDSKTEISDKHDQRLDLEAFRRAIAEGISKARADQKLLREWNGHSIPQRKICDWVDGPLAKVWGVKAATRVFHVCTSALDVDFADPFESGKPSERRVVVQDVVPGAPEPARTLYDVAQALSWVASSRRNAEQRVSWQLDIPRLIRSLAQPNR